MSKSYKYTLMFLFSAMLAATLTVRTAFAQIDCIDFECWWFDNGLQIDYQKIDVTIRNQVATTHLDMQFSSLYGSMIEGEYYLPIPPKATITNLILYINGVPIQGQVLGAVEAGQIYDDYVSQFIDPALVEYVEEDLIKISVFPITTTRRIELEYQEVLIADEGVIDYRFMQNADYSTKEIELQTITVAVESNDEIIAIASDSHPVAIMTDTANSADVSYEATEILPDHNFHLRYQVDQNQMGLDLLSYNPVPAEGEIDENGYFLLSVVPALDVSAEEILPKDVILILDTSGSMSGERITQGKNALLNVMSRLNPQDRFNIVTFNSDVSSYSETLLPATEPGDYTSFVNNINAAGSTNINDALLQALTYADAERFTTILFISDGEATAGETQSLGILSNVSVAMNDRDNIRFFSFGVGSADLQLLESLATSYGGTMNEIVSNDQVESAVSNFYAAITYPLLTNITLDFGSAPVEMSSITPAGPYDLYAGSQLFITGRYRDTITGTFPITVTGKHGGEIQTLVYDSNSFANEGGDQVVSIEWARSTIDDLLAQILVRHGSIPTAYEVEYGYLPPDVVELANSVKSYGIKYSIVTPYTSYLVEEPADTEFGFPPTGEPVPSSVTLSQSLTQSETIKVVVWLLLLGGLTVTITLYHKKRA